MLQALQVQRGFVQTFKGYHSERDDFNGSKAQQRWFIFTPFRTKCKRLFQVLELASFLMQNGPQSFSGTWNSSVFSIFAT